MTWRKAHGRAAQLGRLTVLEATPADELPPARPETPDRPERDAAGRFLPGNRWSRMSRAKAGVGGALASLDAKADPQWRAARRWAKTASAYRIREYGALHGADLSSGICTLLVDAGEMRGDARYLSARARAENNPELLRLAATLLASARQAERDAWELASREAAARRLVSPSLPWLRSAASSADEPVPEEPSNDAGDEEPTADG